MRRHSILYLMTGAVISTGPLVSAQTAGTGGATAATPRVAISLAVFDVNGRSPATMSNAYGADFTHYAYAGKTICQLGGPNFANRYNAMRERFTEVNAARGGAGRGSVTGLQANAAPLDLSQPPTDAGFGWRLDGKITSVTANEIVVQIEWQRMWERGEIVSGPRGSTQLALHPGERVPIDSIAALALPGECSGVTLTLQVAFGGGAGGRGAAGGISNVGAAAGGGGFGGVSGGSGGGASVGRGRGAAGGGGIGGTAVGVNGGAAGGFGGATAGGVSGGGRGGGRGGRGGAVAGGATGGTVVVTSGFDPQTLQPVDVELWLVHKKPDGTEEAQQRSVRTLPGSGEFTFDAVPIATADRSSSVMVTGSVQAQRLADGTEKLFVGIIRRVTMADSTFSNGGSGRTVAMPRAGEVISFEMPDTNLDAFNPFRSHNFSVRVRVNR